MASQWTTTDYPGVRYREHSTRRHGPRRDRYYAIRYRDGAGQRHEEGLGWSSEGWSPAKAADVLSEIRRSVATGDGPQSLREKRARVQAARQEAEAQTMREAATEISFGALLDRYLRAKARKADIRTETCRINRHLRPRFGDMPLVAITRRHVETFRDDLVSGPLAPETARKILGLFRVVLDYARDTSLDEADSIPLLAGPNPASGVNLTSEHGRVVIDNARVRFFSFEEADALLDRAKGKRQLILHDASLLSLHTGLRRGEIMRLRRGHVDVRHAMLNLPAEIAKIREGARLPLNDDVLPMLAERCRGLAPDALLFRCQHDYLTQRMAELTEDMRLNHGVTDGRQRVVFHTWRHTFASWLALAGTDLLRIKELMRHKTIEMTMRYAHLLPDGKRAAVRALTREARVTGSRG